MSDNILDLLDNRKFRATYTEDYKTACFWVWWSRGKPGASSLRGYIEPNQDGQTPSMEVLSSWITNIFKARAEEYDLAVQQKVKETAVTEKIEMLERHASIGKEMQDISIEYLRNHKDDLKPNTALKMLVDGVRIERESKGLPTLITETVNTTDEDLQKALEKLMERMDDPESLSADE